MKVLVIGASGLVGGNCLTYLPSVSDWKVQGTHLGFPTDSTSYFNTLNASDPANFDIDDFDPDVIIQCGALTWVDYCEENPAESYEKTVQAAKNVIALCERFNASLVYTSTDYVFDGKNGPYAEEDALNPLNVYGQHKLEVEELINQQLPNSLILRITNVYGDEIRGKNFVARLVKDLQADKEINLQLPHDQFATPVNAKDIARAIYRLLSDNKSGTYHIAGSDYFNRFQMASRVASYFPEKSITLRPIATSQLSQSATRPLLGGLKNFKFINEYPDFVFTNLDDYMKQYLH